LARRFFLAAACAAAAILAVAPLPAPFPRWSAQAATTSAGQQAVDAAASYAASGR
jgi:hypothetical protein